MRSLPQPVMNLTSSKVTTTLPRKAAIACASSESGNNPTLAASGEEGTGEEAASLSTLAMVSRASARLFNVFSFVLMFG